MKTKIPILYPLLFAVYPILFLFSLKFNLTQVPLYQIMMPLLVTILLTLVLWMSLNHIFKNKSKGALLSFLILILFFSYGHLYQGFGFSQHNYLLMIGGILLILGVYFITKTNSNLHNLTIILNFVTSLLVISTLTTIVPYQLKRLSTEKTFAQVRSSAYETKARKTNITPDIYYLIFDRYANSNVLKESFNYDNSGFIDYLTKKGFFVATESHSNYPSTLFSLTSSLNMEYLDYLEVIDNSDDYTIIYDLIQDHRVGQILKSRNYKLIHFGDWWDPTKINPLADMNFNYTPLGSNGFSETLLKTTVIYPIIELFIEDDNTQNRKRILYKFEKLAEVSEIEGPKFIFAHMLIPHDPYVFGPNGEPLTPEVINARSEIENYTNQLIFTNKKIKQLIDEILSKSGTPPIIIIQSDEGPLITPEFRSAKFLTQKDWSQISQEELKTHLKILNAYYLPNFDQNLLYESISPVNSFRIVFNFYFDTDYELLEDKAYISVGAYRPYNFVEITDILSNEIEQ